MTFCNTITYSKYFSNIQSQNPYDTIKLAKYRNCQKPLLSKDRLLLIETHFDYSLQEFISVNIHNVVPLKLEVISTNNFSKNSQYLVTILLLLLRLQHQKHCTLPPILSKSYLLTTADNTWLTTREQYYSTVIFYKI